MIKNNIKNLLALSIIILVAIISIVTVVLVSNRTVIDNNKAATVSTATLSPNTTTLSLVTGQTKKITYTLSTASITDKISGFDIYFSTTGVVQVTKVDNVVSNPIGTATQVVNQTTANSAHIAYIYPAANTSLPMNITFDISVVANSLGAGTLNVTLTNTKVVGPVLNNTYSLNLIPAVNITNNTITTTVANTTSLTTVPVTTTQATTTTVPNCLCGTDNKCSNSCVYNSNSYSGYSCQRELAVGGAITQDDKDSYCNRADRAKGDTDGLNGVDSTDYFYYVRSVNGGLIPHQVNPDVNGDGVISINDRKIIIQNIK